jgi:hypothetical protein
MRLYLTHGWNSRQVLAKFCNGPQPSSGTLSVLSAWLLLDVSCVTRDRLSGGPSLSCPLVFTTCIPRHRRTYVQLPSLQSCMASPVRRTTHHTTAAAKESCFRVQSMQASRAPRKHRRHRWTVYTSLEKASTCRNECQEIVKDYGKLTKPTNWLFTTFN